MSKYTPDFTGLDMLDVRDIIARVEELNAEREEIEGREETANELAAWHNDYDDEYNALSGLLDELKGNGGDEQWEGDWYPIMLIRDSHFESAMDELLEDIGDIPKDLPGYLKITVDYDALQMDYSSVEFDGVTYWYR